MRSTIVRSDGIAIEPGDWLDIGTGIGKFSGAWENPTLGLMCSLNYFRRFDRPQESSTLFISMSGDIKPDDPLHRAVKVTGPLCSDGRRPEPIVERSPLRIIDGGKR